MDKCLFVSSNSATAKRINFTRIFIFLVLLSLIVPGYFQTFPFLKNLFLVTKALAFLCSLLYLLIVRKSMSGMSVCVFLLFAVICFSTFLNGGNLNRVISVACSVLSILFVFEIFSKNYSKFLINSFVLILGIYIIINLFTLVLFPNGFYVPATWEELDGDFYAKENWFLGFKNHHVRYYFPMLYFLFLKKRLSCFKNKIFMNLSIVLFVTIIAISSVLCGSATVIGGFVIFIVCYALSYLFKDKLFDMRIVSIVFLVLFAFIVLGNAGFLVNFVDFIFGKSRTFTERMDVWSRSIDYIFGSFSRLLIGAGKMYNLDLIDIIGYNNTHNSMLEILLQGGLICFGLFLIQIVIITKRNQPLKHSYPRVFALNTIMLISLFSMMQVESMYFENTICALFAAMYFIIPHRKEFNEKNSNYTCSLFF